MTVRDTTTRLAWTVAGQPLLKRDPSGHKSINVECPPRDWNIRPGWAMWAMHLWLLTQDKKTGMKVNFPIQNTQSNRIIIKQKSLGRLSIHSKLSETKDA